MKITPWTKVALYDAIMRHTLDAAYPTTRVRKGRGATFTTEDPDVRRKAAAAAAGRLTFILAYYDMPRFPA